MNKSQGELISAENPQIGNKIDLYLNIFAALIHEPEYALSTAMAATTSAARTANKKTVPANSQDQTRHWTNKQDWV
jgi:hypothetical protein